jgi:hypothetical protein
MILIWSGEGGPLQRIGMVALCLQIIGPHLFQLYMNLQSIHHASTAGNDDTPINYYDEILPRICLTLALGTGLAAVTVGTIGGWNGIRTFIRDELLSSVGGLLSRQGRSNNNNDGTSTVTRSTTDDNPIPGTTANPVLIHDVDMNINGNSTNDNNTNNNNIGRGGRSNNIQSSSIVGEDNNNPPTSSSQPLLVLALVVAYVSIIIASPIVWNALQHSNGNRVAWSGTTTSSVFHYPGNSIIDTGGVERGGMTFTYNLGFIQLVLVAMGAHVLMAFAAYRLLRDVLAGGDNVFTYPGNLRGSGGGSSRRRRRKLTVSEIADIVRKVPVEEFVSNEELRSGECSVTRMKRMMTNRGATEIAAKCIERDDLVCELEKIRKFNDECSICAEEYVEGDILRITSCRHEFHLHCFDRWMYTYSTDSRWAAHPSCPLCKSNID